MAGSGRGVYVSIRIGAPRETVWRLTQDPHEHARWDLRFSTIVEAPGPAEGARRFRYERALPGHVIRGTGTAIGERHRPDGTSTSALRFATDDPVSPLRAGRGYWRYTADGDGTVFTTGFDYEPGWGRVLDALVVRPFVRWATAWSFDRLRVWAERGEPPERWPVRSVLAVWRRDRPRASRCRRRPPERGAFAEAPATLDGLAAP